MYILQRPRYTAPYSMLKNEAAFTINKKMKCYTK